MDVAIGIESNLNSERLCVRDELLAEQGKRRCLLDGFIIRWFDAFGPEATQANRSGSNTLDMVLFEIGGLYGVGAILKSKRLRGAICLQIIRWSYAAISHKFL